MYKNIINFRWKTVPETNDLSFHPNDTEWLLSASSVYLFECVAWIIPSEIFSIFIKANAEMFSVFNSRLSVVSLDKSHWPFLHFTLPKWIEYLLMMPRCKRINPFGWISQTIRLNIPLQCLFSLTLFDSEDTQTLSHSLNAMSAHQLINIFQYSLKWYNGIWQFTNWIRIYFIFNSKWNSSVEVDKIQEQWSWRRRVEFEEK